MWDIHHHLSLGLSTTGYAIRHAAYLCEHAETRVRLGTTRPMFRICASLVHLSLFFNRDKKNPRSCSCDRSKCSSWATKMALTQCYTSTLKHGMYSPPGIIHSSITFLPVPLHPHPCFCLPLLACVRGSWIICHKGNQTIRTWKFKIIYQNGHMKGHKMVNVLKMNLHK